MQRLDERFEHVPAIGASICQLTQAQSPLARLHVEHVRPIKHQGRDDIDNLALACIDCNLHKGTNVAGYDPWAARLLPCFIPDNIAGRSIFAGRAFILSASRPSVGPQLPYWT